MKGPRKTLLASSILAIPSLAHALGLGGIEVKSGLNEPLNAEIQVIQAAPGEADGLAVALASAEDFARVGIDRARMDMPLSFAVGKASNGQAVIKVTSAVPVREPFLNFLLEVNWSKGRLLREYTVLLDPPVSAPSRGNPQVATAPVRDTKPVTPVQQAPATPAAPVKPAAPVAAPKPAPAAAPAPATAPAAAQPAAPAPGEYGPVNKGETLWEIAQATRPDGVSDMNRFMIALLRMNPDAFYEENINALKRGAILRIPSGNEVNSIAASEASAAVRNQNELWRGYQSAQAATPTRLADAGASESLRTPPASTGNGGSRLSLLPPREGDAQGAADRPGSGGLDRSDEVVKNLRGDLARSQEDLVSSRQEVSELRSRVTDLEKIKSDQDKVLSLRNDELKSLQTRAAELEQRIRELEAQAAAAPVAAVDSASTEEPKPTPDIWKPEDAAPPADTSAAPAEPVEPAEPPTDVTEPTDIVAEPPVDTTPAEPAPSEPVDSTAVTQPVAEPEPVKPEPVPEPAPAEGGLFSNPWVLGGVGAALLALLGLLFARFRRKPEAESGDFTAADEDHGGFFPAEHAPQAAADDGDAEEEALLDQIAMNPGDLRARLALLELYHGRQNAAEFETAARAMRAQIASEDQPEWRQAVALGASILPGHAMFAAQDDFPDEVNFDEPEHSPSEPMDGGLDISAFEDREPAAEISQPPAPLQAAESNFDFDFDLDSPTEAIAPVAAPVAKAEPEPQPEPEPVAAHESAAGDELSFDFDLDVPATRMPEPEPQPEPAPVEPVAASREELSLDLPEIDFANMAEPELDRSSLESGSSAPNVDDELGDLGVFGDDAVATKLDLARAYMDMGDPDGARSMLEEVIGEGNAEQKDEARKLLDGLR
ncbi:MAG: FimV/HubP family polar landmark protein [Lysobacterales bacterium]